MSGQKIEEHKSDVEKRGSIDLGQRGEEILALPSTYSSNSFTKRLLSWGVESRGSSGKLFFIGQILINILDRHIPRPIFPKNRYFLLQTLLHMVHDEF